jgi:hypothetical protein
MDNSDGMSVVGILPPLLLAIRRTNPRSTHGWTMAGVVAKCRRRLQDANPSHRCAGSLDERYCVMAIGDDSAAVNRQTKKSQRVLRSARTMRAAAKKDALSRDSGTSRRSNPTSPIFLCSPHFRQQARASNPTHGEFTGAANRKRDDSLNR